MVNSATSFSSSGTRDWIVQRISAVILGIYLITLLVFFAFNPVIQFEAWQSFFHYPFMKLFSFLALLSLVAHAWVGVWTIFTDYIKPTSLRLLLEALMVLVLLGYLAWGITIIW